ncbi:uncharacterized protein JNUCC1_00113 [Lentibacillus sp. JNUCC-1]|uniref:DUF1641 domain-containing protein n=1 Tax=Lentibacillus sp. JNUCC-1 TaxID=2654513 RepID=UPI0012E8CE0A|nr:DUF1641 domain-containing protein [Lentibacillus sp. JNUCC-1]MUV36312.1 uncharacterized protein [Lentibacillus sp. JNUCC-1]
MAEPIKTIKYMEPPSIEERREQNTQDILNTLGDHKDAIVSGIELLDALHESGLLDMLTALVKQKDTAIEQFVTELNKEQYTGILENLGQLLFLAGELDVEDMRDMISRVNSGVSEAAATTHKHHTTYMDLVKALKNPEINRSVTLILQFLKGMGVNSFPFKTTPLQPSGYGVVFIF